MATGFAPTATALACSYRPKTKRTWRVALVDCTELTSFLWFTHSHATCGTSIESGRPPNGQRRASQQQRFASHRCVRPRPDEEDLGYGELSTRGLRQSCNKQSVRQRCDRFPTYTFPHNPSQPSTTTHSPAPAILNIHLQPSTASSSMKQTRVPFFLTKSVPRRSSRTTHVITQSHLLFSSVGTNTPTPWGGPCCFTAVTVFIQ